MKIAKYLIILVLTLFWVLLILIPPMNITNPLAYYSIATAAYGLLVYLVWPIGTTYSSIALNRFYIVLGIAGFLLAADVLLNNQCPTFPSSFTKTQNSGAATLMHICIYLGKIPTSLLLSLFSGGLIYTGYTKKLNPPFNP